jgi:hypothetical protein
MGWGILVFGAIGVSLLLWRFNVVQTWREETITYLKKPRVDSNWRPGS